MNTFQLFVTGAFIFFLIAGVLIFAGVGGFGGKKDRIGPVVIWGTYDERVINNVIEDLAIDDNRLDDVSYVEKDPRSFNEELVEALASGSGPDLFFLKQDNVLRHRDKIQTIPYDVMSEREFRDTFIEEGELFLNDSGITALPFIIDPMVMYWNRNHYANSGIAQPPQFWDEFLPISMDGELTKRGETGAILLSALAMGEYQNIAHSKELLSTLIMQAGSRIVAVDSSREDNGNIISQLDLRIDGGQTPAENALRFYTDFANSVKSVYSWNRSLPEARSAFVGEKLATYFGFASELQSIREQNPNLNFDVALIPQVRNSNINVSFGSMVGLAVPKASQNINGAVSVAFILTSSDAISMISDAVSLAPIRRDLLATRPTDPFKSIFADATLQSRAWLDPDTKKTEDIFKNMIESVISGRSRISDAIQTADTELGNLLRRY